MSAFPSDSEFFGIPVGLETAFPSGATEDEAGPGVRIGKRLGIRVGLLVVPDGLLQVGGPISQRILGRLSASSHCKAAHISDRSSRATVLRRPGIRAKNAPDQLLPTIKSLLS